MIWFEKSQPLNFHKDNTIILLEGDNVQNLIRATNDDKKLATDITLKQLVA